MGSIVKLWLWKTLKVAYVAVGMHVCRNMTVLGATDEGIYRCLENAKICNYEYMSS